MIGIIGAMEQEVSHLIASLDAPVSETLCGVTLHRGRLAGQEVVLARAGVGKVNAALCTQTMLLHCHPTLILNTGVAGAISPDLTVMDAVVAAAYVEHDMDTTPIGDPPGLVTVAGTDRVTLPTDPPSRDLLLRACLAVGLRARCGVVATGDQFIATREQKERIRRLFSADAAEMEGAAIAHACLAAGVPFSSLRVISDTADGASGVDYPTFVAGAAEKSAAAVLHFLSLL